MLIQRGTLKVGDIIVCGGQWGRVRALIDDRGQNLEQAGPSVPVEIIGLDGVPDAGDPLVVVENERRAREITEYRQRKRRAQTAATAPRGSVEEMFSQLAGSEAKELPVVVKSDVHGSIEAIVAGAREAQHRRGARCASCTAASARSPNPTSRWRSPRRR